MVILFGLAGSGKSTQGQILAEKNGWKWLSVGQVIRDTGRFEEETKKGLLIDDNVVIDLMSNEISKAEANGFDLVLDGFPRDAVQAEWVANNLTEKIKGAIYLEVPKDELYERLKLRGRNDDTKDAIKRRFEATEQNIYTILSLLSAKNIATKTVNGVGTIEEVTARLESVLK